MAAFVILFMFVVGVGLGGWAVAYYLQVVSPERARSFLASHGGIPYRRRHCWSWQGSARCDATSG